jgi:hypothetical protein
VRDRAAVLVWVVEKRGREREKREREVLHLMQNLMKREKYSCEIFYGKDFVTLGCGKSDFYSFLVINLGNLNILLL